MLKILHFADAHIDIANHGRHDPDSGLTVRAMDFLRALDTIIDAAIAEPVDLVIFAGDAYKDRTPTPTFQREWGRRMMRLSRAGIQTVLLVGNHDLPPAAARAHALQEFDTLEIPCLHVAGKPALFLPEQLGGLPLQLIALPWVSRSSFMAASESALEKPGEAYAAMEDRITQLVDLLVEKLDPELPAVLTAHASVEGAKYGSEQSVMLGNDLTLSGSLVRNSHFNYVALGHIHKAQDLNEGYQPPVIYPGSIERVDFGEAMDEKYYVIAQVEAGQPTQVEWRKLNGRRFIDCRKEFKNDAGQMPPEWIYQQLIAVLPSQEEMQDAVVRLTVTYPHAWTGLLDEVRLRQYTEGALEFHYIPRPIKDVRVRLADGQTLTSLTDSDLLAKYWEASHAAPEDEDKMRKMAEEIFIEYQRNHE